MVSKYMYMYICFDCLVRIFLRAAAHVGDSGVITCMTSLGVGGVKLSSFPPPPDLVVHVRAPLLAYVLAVLVACSTLTTFGAWGPGLPPIHRLGRALALPFANTIFNSNYKFKLKCQIRISK